MIPHINSNILEKNSDGGIIIIQERSWKGWKVEKVEKLKKLKLPDLYFNF